MRNGLLTEEEITAEALRCASVILGRKDVTAYLERDVFEGDYRLFISCSGESVARDVASWDIAGGIAKFILRILEPMALELLRKISKEPKAQQEEVHA